MASSSDDMWEMRCPTTSTGSCIHSRNALLLSVTIYIYAEVSNLRQRSRLFPPILSLFCKLICHFALRMIVDVKMLMPAADALNRFQT